MDRARQELLAPLVGHPHDRRVDIEHARRRCARAHRASRRARGSARTSARPRRAREAGAPPRARRRAPPRAPPRAGSPARGAGRSGRRPRAARRARRAAPSRARPPPRRAFRIRGKQPDHFPARDKRNGERRADAGLARGRRDGREPQVSHDVRDLEHRPLRRAEREVEQALGDARVRAGEPRLAASSSSPSPAPEVDGDAVDAEQLGDALDGGLERVRDRELRCRLHDHLEQRARARSSSSASSRARSPMRSACAARTPNVASRVELLGRRLAPVRDGTAGGRRRRQGLRAEAPSLRRARLRERDPMRGETATSPPPRSPRGRRPKRRRRRRRGGRSPRRRLPPQRGRERLAGELERRPRERGDAGSGREGAEDESAWAAQSSAASRCSAANGSPERSSSSETAALRPARPSRRRVAPVCNQGSDAPAARRHGGRRWGASEVVERRFRELRRRHTVPASSAASAAGPATAAASSCRTVVDGTRTSATSAPETARAAAASAGAHPCASPPQLRRTPRERALREGRGRQPGGCGN